MINKSILVTTIIMLAALYFTVSEASDELYGLQSGINSQAISYDVTTGLQTKTFATNFEYNSELVFGSDGYLYGFGNYGSSDSPDIVVWDTATGQQVNSFGTDFHWGTGLTFTPTVIPEPVSTSLFITGGLILGIRRFIRK